MIASSRSAASSDSTKRATLAGIGLMLLGTFLFCVNDALGKWLLITYSVGQMLLIRSVAALIVLSPFILREGASPFRAAPRPTLQIIRVVLSAAEVAMFFLAVSYLPLADTVAFYLAGPIYVTALSALILGEHVGWRRWTAVLVGFAGVLIALQPSPETFTWPALIALLGGFFFALLMIVTRHLRGTHDIVLASGQIGATFVLAYAIAPFAWKVPDAADYALMSLLGVVAAVALMCVNRSLKLAPASVVVPYQYTLILWAMLLGWLVFGDVPTVSVVAGTAIIIAAGLYIFFREQAYRAKEPVVMDPP